MKVHKITFAAFFAAEGLTISLILGSVSMAGNAQTMETGKPFSAKQRRVYYREHEKGQIRSKALLEGV